MVINNPQNMEKFYTEETPFADSDPKFPFNNEPEFPLNNSEPGLIDIDIQKIECKKN
jgi:hypothetical protein